MNNNSDKPVNSENPNVESKEEKEPELSATAEIHRKTFIEDFPTKYHASLEIIGLGETKKHLELVEEDVVIGRTVDCDIQLSIENVSRRHALISFRNEEYQIEDLGSTNGIYVNGIKVEKCILRNNDHIKIPGVDIIFRDKKV